MVYIRVFLFRQRAQLQLVKKNKQTNNRLAPLDWQSEPHAHFQLPDQFLLAGCTFVFLLRSTWQLIVSIITSWSASRLLWPNRQEGIGGQEAADDSRNLLAVFCRCCCCGQFAVYFTHRQEILQTAAGSLKLNRKCLTYKANEMNNSHCGSFLK